MKIGIFTALFHDRPIEEALDAIAAAGIQAVELGAGAYPGDRHLKDLGGVQKLIDDAGARKKLGKLASDRGLILDSLSVHGNPLHPVRSIADEHHKAFEDAVLLVEKLHQHREPAAAQAEPRERMLPRGEDLVGRAQQVQEDVDRRGVELGVALRQLEQAIIVRQALEHQIRHENKRLAA